MFDLIRTDLLDVDPVEVSEHLRINGPYVVQCFPLADSIEVMGDDGDATGVAAALDSQIGLWTTSGTYETTERSTWYIPAEEPRPFYDLPVLDTDPDPPAVGFVRFYAFNDGSGMRLSVQDDSSGKQDVSFTGRP